MGKSQPAPPPAPDLAAAQVAGVNADISTLPLRNAINAASQLGTSYTDPSTGRTYDFTGLGSADVGHAQLMQQIADSPEATNALLNLQRQYGGQFAQEARNQLAITDPEGFALRQQFGGNLLNGKNTMQDLMGRLPNVPDYERATNGPTLNDSPENQSARSQLQQQTYDELSRAGNGALDPVLQRAAEQASRARGAAVGNTLGDSSALAEAQSVQLAQRDQANAARSNALNLLGSGQTNSATQNSLAQQSYQNVMNAINQRNQASQNQFTAGQQNVQAQQGARQQDLANIQSFLGLQPIVSQGAQLSGLQQGAAPFLSGSGYNAGGTNANAGAQGAGFASNIFGTQAGMYGQQLQNNQSPVGAILGGFAGAASGGVGSAVGKSLGNWFTCHVAREVYGANNPQWLLFYEWKELHAPVWFRKFYNRFSVQIAALIRPYPRIKNLVRHWMDSKIKEL